MWNVPVVELAFTPRRITNLVGWYDGADTSSIIQSGGDVSQWSDKSGNGNHATQAVGVNQPKTGTRTLNGRNTIAYNGVDDYLKLPSGMLSIPTGANTILAVFQNDNTTQVARSISGKTGATTNYGLLYIDTVNQFSFRNGGNNQLAYTPDTSAHIYGLRRNGTTLDGYLAGSVGSTSTASNVTLDELNFAWDNANTGGQAFGGTQAEIVFYSRDLTNAEINLVALYFSAKWGPAWTPV